MALPAPTPPRHRALALALGTSALLLAGCATMSEDACRVADWQRVGRDDGARGLDDRRLADHVESCRKAGVTPDAAAWRRGWDNGVMVYCTPAVGWREGAAGNSYNGVCRGRGEDLFLANFTAATELRKLQGRIDTVGADSKRLEGQLAAAKTDDERKSLRERLRRNDLELVRLRATLAAMPSGPRP